MSPTELESVRQKLLGFRAECAASIRASRASVAIELHPDAIDNATSLSERDTAGLGLDTDFAKLKLITAALDGVMDGTYGTCMHCELDISSERLKAVPWALYCVACQDMKDRAAADDAIQRRAASAGSVNVRISFAGTAHKVHDPDMCSLCSASLKPKTHLPLRRSVRR